MEKIPLTKREQQIFDYVLCYRMEKQYSPNMREICAGVGLNSTSCIHKYIYSMAEKGWLLPYCGRAGSIVPIQD